MFSDGRMGAAAAGHGGPQDVRIGEDERGKLLQLLLVQEEEEVRLAGIVGIFVGFYGKSKKLRIDLCYPVL